MARRSACAGRPRKHSGGWESVNSRIYLSKETLVEWRRLRSNLEFSNDNAVAIFLLHRNNILADLMARESSAIIP